MFEVQVVNLYGITSLYVLCTEALVASIFETASSTREFRREVFIRKQSRLFSVLNVPVLFSGLKIALFSFLRNLLTCSQFHLVVQNSAPQSIQFTSRYLLAFPALDLFDQPTPLYSQWHGSRSRSNVMQICPNCFIVGFLYSDKSSGTFLLVVLQQKY